MPRSSKPGVPAPASTAEADPVDWDAKIEQHLRAKSQDELADLVWSLVRRFPEVYQEFRERIALQEGDVERLVAEARREIRKVTSEPAWRNHWNGEGHRPDYSRDPPSLRAAPGTRPCRRGRVAGPGVPPPGMEQVGQSHDEGETATAFAECLPVVFEAVTQSSLSGPERLLFAIDAELADDFDAIGDATAVGPRRRRIEPEDWSAVADTLIGAAGGEPSRRPRVGTTSRATTERDRVTSWIATALEEAGRDEEVSALYESEARATGSYERLVAFLIEEGLSRRRRALGARGDRRDGRRSSPGSPTTWPRASASWRGSASNGTSSPPMSRGSSSSIRARTDSTS